MRGDAQQEEHRHREAVAGSARQASAHRRGCAMREADQRPFAVARHRPSRRARKPALQRRHAEQHVAERLRAEEDSCMNGLERAARSAARRRGRPGAAKQRQLLGERLAGRAARSLRCISRHCCDQRRRRRSARRGAPELRERPAPASRRSAELEQDEGRSPQMTSARTEVAEEEGDQPDQRVERRGCRRTR